jgi:hypothetical protein
MTLFNNNWSGQTGTKFRVDLYVDGKLVDKNYAVWAARNVAIIQFGNSLTSIKALMNGNVLTIVSEGGQSAFSLAGSYAAALKVADCYDTQRLAASSPQSAFATAPQANSVQPSNAPSSSSVASRAETLELATSYLGNSTIPYKILPADGNKIDSMPVNWTFGNNSIGGMAIIRNSPTTGDDTLTAFLKEQAGACSGKNAMDRKPPQKTKEGMIWTAEGMCQAADGTYSASYKVAQVGTDVLVIVELLALSDAEANPSLKTAPEFSGELLSSFPAR